ncbi:Jag family protein [Desulfogranum mediterraneum]|uniref:Jag family protein n=1 Tax=Desulfogranum mediterraneum TaxID=160661 RepID=UPI00042285CF|nr:protein jag [Desulfogranum mediterraneum]
MTKEKDFFGKDITDVIEQACKAFGASQDELDIDILETGSAGIFGLCRKQAHIRVQRKAAPAQPEEQPGQDAPPEREAAAAQPEEASVTPAEEQEQEPAAPQVAAAAAAATAAVPAAPGEAELGREESPRETLKEEGSKEGRDNGDRLAEPAPAEPPSAEALEMIKSTSEELLALMGFPAEVTVTSKGNTVSCDISSEHEEGIIGAEGRTLDSLQYLLRKMVLQNLPDRFLLSLNAGDFRERRAEELKQRAQDLAAQVKEDGKTQAIPALNPSERRIVHMVLQEDKGVRSRSVGEGLFKKVLIYKPGKGRRSGAKKKRN